MGRAQLHTEQPGAVYTDFRLLKPKFLAPSKKRASGQANTVGLIKKQRVLLDRAGHTHSLKSTVSAFLGSPQCVTTSMSTYAHSYSCSFPSDTVHIVTYYI